MHNLLHYNGAYGHVIFITRIRGCTIQSHSFNFFLFNLLYLQYIFYSYYPTLLIYF
nr:MAG TPA: hypothetical protein [Caudoviricetes sp.]